MQSSYQAIAKGNYWLKNVRLETGFEYDNEDVIRTKTELFSIEIEDGKIKSINPNDSNLKAIDAKAN